MYNIVEVNTVPGIHMHMKPSEGKPRNVAKIHGRYDISRNKGAKK